MKTKTLNVETGTLQTAIVFRMLGEDVEKMKEFYEDYRSHYRHKTSWVIEPIDYKIVADWKKGMTGRELSQKYKMTQSRIDSRIRTVGKFALFNNQVDLVDVTKAKRK